MTVQEEFEITLSKLDDSLIRVSFILDCLIQIAERTENYELCELILAYKKTISSQYIVESILKHEDQINKDI